MTMVNAELTRPLRPYRSSVSQTAAARFSPEWSPTSSRKSMSNSSTRHNQYNHEEINSGLHRTELPVLVNIVHYDGKKSEAIARGPRIERKADHTLNIL